MTSIEARIERLERVTPTDIQALLDARTDNDLRELLAWCAALQTHQNLNPGDPLSADVQSLWRELSLAARAYFDSFATVATSRR